MNEENVNNITKPITLVREDFINTILKDCNQSGLPYFIIESVLSDIIKEVHIVSQKQTEEDRLKYNQELQKIKFNTKD